MNAPLALLLYENLMPGTQLLARLEGLKYRVQAVTPEQLLTDAAALGPMFMVCDLAHKRVDVCALLRQLRANPATAHLPIIAFADEAETALAERAQQAGATLVTSDGAIVPHLEQFIQQALQVD